MLVSGIWNQLAPGPNGRGRTFVEHTRCSARRLGDKCLSVMGLTVRDVGLPDDVYPTIDWDRVPALEALRQLAAACEVKLPADLVAAAPLSAQQPAAPAVTRQEMKTTAAVLETEIEGFRGIIARKEQALARDRSTLAALETCLRVMRIMS